MVVHAPQLPAPAESPARRGFVMREATMTGPLLAAVVYGILTRWPRPVNARPAAHPRTARALWTLILAAAVVLERYGMNRPGQGWTLSEVTRKAWRTDTTLGAWVFRAWWLALAGWLPGHIVAWRRVN